MKFIIEYYARMALLNTKPQDYRSSQSLRATLIAIYMVLSVVNALALYGLWRGVIHSLLDLVILYMFTQILLRNKRERVNQTFNAFLGVGICIGVLHTICSFVFIVDQNQQTISDLGKILFFIIFIWIVVAYGHIVRHASELNLATGISISLGYTLVNAIMLISASQLIGI